MKTSTRKYNEQYRRKHLYIEGYNNPEIVPACSEHKRCDICRSHVQEYGLHNYDTRTGEILHNAFFIDYTCPTCGKSYAVLKTYEDEEKTLKSEKSKKTSNWGNFQCMIRR